MAKHLAESKKINIKLWLLAAGAVILAALLIFGAIKLIGAIKARADKETPDGLSAQSSDAAEDTPGTDTASPAGEDTAPEDTAQSADETPAQDGQAPKIKSVKNMTADELIAGYFYDEAIELLSKDQSSDAQEKLEKAKALKAQLTPYTDKVFHVFFHSLIVDTSLAFDNKGHPAQGYNEWMTTVSEFKKMLPLFLKNDFILFDITQMCDIDESGNVTQKEILLPPGKKPLVISIDDVNYYDYMKPDGFAERLDVDGQGNVVTVVNGEVTYDGDVMPILDAFVREHPEFSFRGAKGIVATTGYQGAFGYRITDLELYPESEQKYMLDKVKEVANALRATGWQIANHSYTHNQYWNNKTMTMEQLKYDTGRWINEIMPYVGKTNILISPFGVVFDQDDERYRYIVSLGFNIYCPVGSNMNARFYGDNMTQERLNLDGYTMMKHPERISKYFFDPSLVLDPSRPPMK